jgi:hypothetical protein
MRPQERAKHARIRFSPLQAGVALSLLAGLVIALVAIPAIGFARMRHRVGLAETQAAMIQSKIRRDVRFDSVDVTYELNGTLWLVGQVRSAGELDALQSAVNSTNPTMEVLWNIRLD